MIGGRRARAGATPRSGFSLIEVLMSIFILGIGVISIAALFPAGIAQQQRSADDVMGPIAANNALAILRSRLAPADFGTFEQFGTIAPRPTVPGDWTWLRPSLLFSDDPDDRHRGANDIFSWFANSLNGPATEFPGGYRSALSYPPGSPWPPDSSWAGWPRCVRRSGRCSRRPSSSETPRTLSWIWLAGQSSSSTGIPRISSTPRHL